LIRLDFTREPRSGDVIRGEVRIPDGPPPRSAVVVVHGFKGFKDWGFFPFVCDRLASAGHAVVSFNFSRNGVGPGLQDFTELDSFGANTLSLELDEVRSILTEVFEGDLLPRRPRKVGVLGHSRGGGQALLASAEDDRVAALATWAAVATFDRWTEETKALWREDGHVWIMNSRTGQHMPLNLTLLEDFEANSDRLDIPAAAERVRAPWLIVHGTDDPTVRPDEARSLANHSRGAKLVLVNGAGHTFQAKHPFGASTPELEEAMARTLLHFEEHLVDPA
jgi:uncharacterized protein